MDKPKFRIGEKVYIVERNYIRTRRKILERTVLVVMNDDGEILYNLTGDDFAYKENDVFKYEEAVEFMMSGVQNNLKPKGKNK